jgi:L-asparagine transporter-like permease
MGIVLFLYTLGAVGYIIYQIRQLIHGENTFFSLLKTVGLLAGIWLVLVIVWMTKSSSDDAKVYSATRIMYEAEYEKALAGNDKLKAIECGRRYYQFIKAGNDATIELKIANDVSSMKI